MLAIRQSDAEQIDECLKVLMGMTQRVNELETQLVVCRQELESWKNGLSAKILLERLIASCQMN